MNLLSVVAPDEREEDPSTRSQTPQPTASNTDDKERQRKEKWARVAFDAEILDVENAAKGERNKRLNLAALRLGEIVGGGYLLEGEVVAALKAAAKKCGLGDRETKTTIASGLGDGKANPRHPPTRGAARSNSSDDDPSHDDYGIEDESAVNAFGRGAESDDQDIANGTNRSMERGLPFLWVGDFGDFDKPEPLRWLIRDLRTGKPFLRAGKCFVLGGDGGAGKGYFFLTLAMSLALGKDLFDTFRPEQSGRVAILAGEDDQQEVHHRIFRIANALGLDANEIALVQKRVGILPLAGEEVSLLALDDARAPQRTALFERLVSQLTHRANEGGFQWSFVGIDPLARFGAANVETDQSTATAFVQALESMAARLPGNPAIGVAHHSSAASVSQGRSNLRGVTGIRNAFRLAMIVDAFETKDGLQGVLLRNDKNNLAPKARPLWLVRMDDEPLGDGRWLQTAGVLRLATPEEAAKLDAVAGTLPTATAEQRELQKGAKVQEAFERDCMSVLECLPSEPDHCSNLALDALLRARRITVGEKRLKGILEYLAGADGGNRAVDLSGGGQEKARQWARRAK